ncbi:MAG: hypothetical protein K2X99_13275 [Gemmatimonadaceae bacterium]|nr:hypothetical protein [Gemmatimonadaceae bacterium]
MSAALRALLAHGIDYAGLFPPTAWTMSQAVEAYAGYRAGPQAWALGRFVTPVARLPEFLEARSAFPSAAWPLAVLPGPAIESDYAAVEAFDAVHGAFAQVTAFEARAQTVEEITRVAAAFGARRALFIELPVVHDPSALIAAVGAAGASAKIRTGGVTPEAIPSAAQVARFLAVCAAAGVACKATAGLHHPVRGEYALTYATDAPRGTLFGFTNVLAAAIAARAGTPEAELVALLEERDPRAWQWSDDGLRWRDHHWTTAAITAARTGFIGAFGSCSFLEPFDDLSQIGWH